MEKELLTQILSQGIFCSLFVWLLYDTRKEARDRENKLNQIIDKLVDKFNVVEDIKDDVDTIKEHLFKHN